jgi:hypothetical protein
VALLIRLAFVLAFVTTYDRHEPGGEGRPAVHSMIKSDAGKFFREAAGILNHYRDGGSWAVQLADGPFLYPRLVALYGGATGLVHYLPGRQVPLGAVGGFFVFQAIAFAACLAVLFVALLRVMPCGVALTTCLFLALEPTNAQYAGALLSECLYLGFLMLAIAGLIVIATLGRTHPLSRAVLFWLGLGVVLGMVYLQRPVSILLPIAFGLAALVAWWDRPPVRRLLALMAIAIGYAAVLAALGAHNQAATGRFAVLPGQTANDPMQYIASKVMALGGGAQISAMGPWRNADVAAAVAILSERATARSGYSAEDLANDLPAARAAYNAAARAVALEVFAANPWLTARVVLTHAARATSHINPFHFLFVYGQIYKPVDPGDAERLWRERLSYLPDIALYSAFVFIPVLGGWVVVSHALWRGRAGRANPGGARPPAWMPPYLHLLLTLMMLYFPALGGWLGNDRYVLPNIVPYAFYWAVALGWALDRIRRRGGGPVRAGRV